MTNETAAPARPIRTLPPPAPYMARHPAHAALYIGAATLISLTQGLGLNLISSNLPNVQGSLSLTTTETVWLMAAYLAPNVSLTLMMTKIRAQFGLRRFAECAIVAFVAISAMHLFVTDFRSALLVRFFAGVAASPLSTLAFLYMLETFPPEKKMTMGVTFAVINISVAMPVARLVSPLLTDMGDFASLFSLEMAMAMLSLAAIFFLPLNPPARAQVFEPLDFVSYVLIAIGLGSIAVTATVGPYDWWLEARWIGWTLAVGIAALSAAGMIELNRSNPLVDLRWILSPQILHFAGILLLFRLILSEQTSGASGFFQAIGLRNEQMTLLYVVMLASTVLAGLATAAVMKPGRAPAIHAAALALLSVGAFMDAHATNLTRPENMLVSQSMIAMAGVMFLPPALAMGFMAAMKKGMNYLLSFLIVFLTTQSLGGAVGSAIFRTIVTLREKFHSQSLVEDVVMSDPTVAARVARMAAAYAPTTPDPAIQQARALAALSAQATREATILAYNDAFLLVSGVSAFGLGCLLLHVLFRHIFPPTEPAAT